MTAPVRLLESSQNPAARELLRAGLRERPRSSALRAAALSVGVSSSALFASTSATAAAGPAVALAAPSLSLVAAKWLAIGTLGGLALAGGATAVSDLTTPPDVSPAPRAVSHRTAFTDRGTGAEAALVDAPSPPAVRGGASRLGGDGDAARDVAAPAKAVPARSAKRAAAPAVSAAPAAPASATLPTAHSLSREIALIDGARRDLGGGDASRALQKLNEYESLARTGTLDREAQLLRIDALSQSGQRALGRALAERYVATHPNDPHSARLRALLGAP